MSPPRLLSPIQLTPSPPVKRRVKLHRRRRPLSCVDCQLEPMLHPFDQLPWISALEATPRSLSPWDIADLSQIADPFSPGPIRRRKTSLRSNPMALPPTPTPPTQRSDDVSWAAGSTLPSNDTPISRSQTPPPRFTPSRVLFHNLMPVYNDQPRDCTFTPSLPR